MKTSVCLTVFNETKNIRSILIPLIKYQGINIIIVDGGSKDDTVEKIKELKRKYKNIKLIIKKCTRAEGRNIAVRNAESDIIAMTDAGCIPQKDWLKKITLPFKDNSVDLVAGFYEMKAKNPLQTAMSAFLGVQPKEYDVNFLPSTRSVAFRKSFWKKIGGFPENLKDTAEDTIFNQKAIEAGANIVRVKDAVVEWVMPETVTYLFNKISAYAKGDAVSRVFWHPTKRWKTHNIKTLTIFTRYFMFLFAFLLHISIFILFSGAYLGWAFYKVSEKTENTKAGLWGVFLQPVSDIAVMKGFAEGIIRN